MRRSFRWPPAPASRCAPPAEAKGSPDFTPLWSGQAPTFAREMPTAELMATLVKETEAVMKRLS